LSEYHFTGYGDEQARRFVTMARSVGQARVLKVLKNGHEQTWEQISSQLPDLDWNELFAIFDVLTRRGIITMRRQGAEYVLKLTHEPFATKNTASTAVARLHGG
jgi:hypothetical protein